MRNDLQTAHLDAYNRMLDGIREVVALMTRGLEAAARDRYAQLIQEYAYTLFQAGMNAYQSRQAEMIAQWKDSAKKDGWATYGLWFWQLSEGHLAVSTALNEMTAEQVGFTSELTSLTQETADQVRMAVARNDAMIDSLYASTATGTQNFARWRAVQNGSADFNYAVPLGGRAFQEDLSADLFKLLGSKLQEAFRWLLPSSPNEFPLLTWYRFGHTLMEIGVSTMIGAAGLSLLTTTGGLLLASLGAFLYALGWTLAIYLSYLPLLIWLVQFMAWLITAVIAAFGMPLWMLMHLSGEGDGISGARAQSGYGLLLSLLLRPVLLVFGLYAAIALLYVLGWFIEQTLGTTLKNPPNSLFESIGLILIYMVAIVMLGHALPTGHHPGSRTGFSVDRCGVGQHRHLGSKRDGYQLAWGWTRHSGHRRPGDEWGRCVGTLVSWSEEKMKRFFWKNGAVGLILLAVASVTGRVHAVDSRTLNGVWQCRFLKTKNVFESSYYSYWTFEVAKKEVVIFWSPVHKGLNYIYGWDGKQLILDRPWDPPRPRFGAFDAHMQAGGKLVIEMPQLRWKGWLCHPVTSERWPSDGLQFLDYSRYPWLSSLTEDGPSIMKYRDPEQYEELMKSRQEGLRGAR